MLEIGSIVDGKYKILNKIGQGGMSVVYLAMNERANKQWAIKQVRKDGVKDFEVVKQGLIVEIDMLKRLSHPNLPSIIDVIDRKDNFLIVMDYIQGNSLKNRLDEFGAQPQELVIEWAKQLSDVLGYLHTRKPAIIYRDMKPSNIMLKPDGKLTLIDFGTAREYKEKNLADTTCLGTIGYAAPEQFGGKGQTDGRTDIYCLGATLYHLVTGMNPSEPPYEIKPIREINSSLSSGLEKIILRCTQRNPEDRYQSCAELTYALEHYDEIDDIFRSRQKKKLAAFITTAVMTIVSLGVGTGFGKAAEAKTDEQYEDVIAEANSLTNEESIRETLKKAISIKPGDKEAYISLIESYYNPQYGDENDMYNFSVKESQEIEELLNDYSSDLKANKSNYVEVSYELAKAYFFYYTYGNEHKSGDNENAKYKAAKKWYKNVIDHSDENTFLYWNESKIYYEISEYYTSIGDWENTGDFKGKYLEYFSNYTQLFALASDNKKINNDNIKLRMYQLLSSALAAKTEKFINDGVPAENVQRLLDQMQTEMQAIENPDSNLESLISSINASNQKIEIKMQAMSGS